MAVSDAKPRSVWRRSDLVIVYDPAVLGPEKYARLVGLLRDLVRAEGGIDLEQTASAVVWVEPANGEA